ncbi:uncharacterized protein SPPG_02704 [Spizellomyces punctatus DAOM BR117]|uniref:Rho-GAP domain-containing protein n=1 Tax=Spizellomyces punctatus (strain DAOM BR117) TaxID=645134 RepID=A0A0L0HLB0_SPIPD|nr:uncharacterized protein SPPG_02704 [Spizellomyces punctatus DAOM BR117]KND02221.1 hypothetical protein SPPG_02704 [Spizellomyces punctatus DAOM BR117]|eukprot:XP_016610260.1 hypothetical protein SPPG_02704 [Spizellomyces punctatus DAOM BR117]
MDRQRSDGGSRGRRERTSLRTHLPLYLNPPMVRSVDFASVSRDTGANPVNARRLPIIVHECVKFIRTHGLKTTGIFRVNGSERRMAQLAVHFDSPPTYGLGSSFEGYTVYDVADFLKKYLRGVPEPLFTTELYPQFLKCLDVPAEGGTRIRAFRLLLLLLPPTHLVLLETLLELFGLIVQHSAANQMSAHSLARIFSPNVLRPKGQKQPLEEYERCSCVMELLIDHWDHFIVTPCTVRPFQMLDLTYASVREFLGISNLDGFPGIPQMSGQTLNENGFSTTPSIENEEAENSIGKGAVDSKRMVAVDTAPNIPLAKAVDSDCDSGIVSESGTVNITLVRRVRTAPTKRTRGVPENVTADPKQNAVLRNIPEDRSSVVVFPGRPPKKLRGIGSMTHLRRRTLATDPSSLFADPGDDSSNNQAQELEMLRRANEELTAHLEAVLSHI